MTYVIRLINSILVIFMKLKIRKSMMQFKGVLKKMLTEYNQPIDYYLEMENGFLHLNELLNKDFEITFKKYQCLSCGQDKPIFRQGFCQPCFYAIPQAGVWIMHPELSTAHLDIEDRDLAYEKKVQLQPHIVYLSLSSEIKVGVTRKTQVPERWIDQGAVQAIEIVEVPNRYLAGIAEVALKDHFADKTNWQKMLKNDIPEVDLVAEKEQLRHLLPKEVQEYFVENGSKLFKIQFPILQYPLKISSLNLIKTPNYKGKLVGVKGQYLIFEDNMVFNVRNSEGFVVKIQV